MDEALDVRLRVVTDPWPAIEAVRKDAHGVLDAALRFGMEDDKGGYEAGRAFFLALADRMHLSAGRAKCADFCAKAVARHERNLGLRARSGADCQTGTVSIPATRTTSC